MSWDLTGQRVTATYLRTVPFTGTVVESRVKYGGTVQHTVELDVPMPIFGTIRTRLLVTEGDLNQLL